MNIVQEQNAFAECLKPAHRERNDLIGLDMAMPVVGVGIGREDDQAPRGELAFEDVGAGKAGDAEERRQKSGAAKGGSDVGNAPVDLGNWPKRNGWFSYACRSCGLPRKRGAQWR